MTNKKDEQDKIDALKKRVEELEAQEARRRRAANVTVGSLEPTPESAERFQQRSRDAYERFKRGGGGGGV